MNDSDASWRPSANIDILRRRAALLTRIREFFAARNVLEVETPSLSRYTVTAPHLESFTALAPIPAGHDNLAAERFLQTSPEYAMKRLLVAGSGDIYQICRAFRAGEAGRLHNPEFTLLEWYRVEMSYRQLMHEVADLVLALLDDRGLDETPEFLSYRNAFVKFTELNPLQASVQELASCGARHGIVTASVVDARDTWLDLLMTHVIEPKLPRDRLVFIYDFPASQAALAELCKDAPQLAARFELYVNGVELANGFQELRDAAQQRRRFEIDQEYRREHDLSEVAVDEQLLAALQYGLPLVSGVALGIDRLVMLAAGKKSIAEVMAFSDERC